MRKVVRDWEFADNAIDLIDEIITDNISNIDDYDTVEEFLDSIKLALEDGEFISTLDSNEDIINIAYSMLENKAYKLDKGVILNHFIDKSGLKKGSVYEILGMNNSTFIRKIENNFNFSHAELVKIKEVLNLSDEDFLKLF